ncbi:nuclear transport factor 2 family protein [Mobilitalea sibirica]|uniref:Nuclear transport factor 2 family protein n=1 Tax=Mobilitalea sibirica TaxID=1462919 RepID=A0A8J7L2G7_9FIRM|nr:nuclear transport factor 2 family protein [Mobilitalea sibirica]MBH1940568.1 nuclear transport factor 2 family protein [Mobilitalea sibirica]
MSNRRLFRLLMIISVIMLFGCSQRDNDASENESDTSTVLKDVGNDKAMEKNENSGKEPEITEEIKQDILEPRLIYNSDTMVLPEIDTRNKEWIETFNSTEGSFGEFYTSTSLFFPEKECILQDSDAIINYYKDMAKSSKIQNFTVEHRVQLEENSSVTYEIGHFSTNGGDEYQYLVAWLNEDGIWFREIDAIAKKENQLNYESEIDSIRETWIRLANEHSSVNLVEGVYSEDFVYYGGRRLFQGYENLAREYSYMNAESFTMNLTADKVALVQSDLAYEIGEWDVGFTGKYIIIWKKINNEWKTWLDANW